jgi:hypothetical protein
MECVEQNSINSFKELAVRLTFIALSFLFSLSVFAQASWIDLTETLMTQDGSVPEARAQLEKMPDLDQKLQAALGKGGRERKYALELIRILPRPSMVAALKKEIDSTTEHDQLLVTLMSLSAQEKGNEILEYLGKKINLHSEMTSSSLKIAYLSTLLMKDQSPKVETLTKLLDDPSYDVRLKAMDLAEGKIGGAPESFQVFLKKAVSVSPYPVREKSFQAISQLPQGLKVKFKDAVEKCAKTDQSDDVKNVCRGITF